MSKFTDIRDAVAKLAEPKPEVRAHVMRVEWGNSKKRDRRWVAYLDAKRVVKGKIGESRKDTLARLEAKYGVQITGTTRYTGIARPSEMAMQIASLHHRETP